MVSFSINKDQNELDKWNYTFTLDNMTTKELLQEFFSYLDCTEESDSGRVFNPVVISCVRVMMTEPLNMVLERLRKEVVT